MFASVTAIPGSMARPVTRLTTDEDGEADKAAARAPRRTVLPGESHATAQQNACGHSEGGGGRLCLSKVTHEISGCLPRLSGTTRKGYPQKPGLINVAECGFGEELTHACLPLISGHTAGMVLLQAQ